MRTITVKGIGSMTVPPDTVTVIIYLSCLDKVCETASQVTADKTDEIRRICRKFDFPESALTTTDYTVKTEYEYDTPSGERVFVGFECRHTMYLEIPADIPVLTSLLSELSESTAQPEVSLSFSVENEEELKKKCLEAAAADARERAEILSKASGVILGDLQTIRCTWESLHNTALTDFRMDLAPVGPGNARLCKAPAITPGNIDVVENAEFVWEIK